MKHYLLFVVFSVVSINSYGQEENKINSFINPKETIPRYIEDKKLSEKENLISFRTKIKEHFMKHLERSHAKDSIENKIYVKFKIDRTGVSKFYKIVPHKLETKYLKNEFSNIINSLPKFIPATQRNRKINSFFVIPVFKNK